MVSGQSALVFSFLTLSINEWWINQAVQIM